MGNQQSDSGEQKAHNVIQHVPAVGSSYSAVRSLVYAGKGNSDEAIKSAKAIWR